MSTKQSKRNRLRQLLATAIFIIIAGVMAALTVANTFGSVSDANLVRFILIMVTLAAMVLIVAANNFPQVSQRSQDQPA